MKERSHRPEDLGPRIYRRGRFFSCDLRPFGMARVAMRDPKHPGWPHEGERTSLPEIASRWKWDYLALARGEHRRRVLRLPAKQKRISELARPYLDARLETFERTTWLGDQTAVRYLVEHFGGLTPSEVTTEKLSAWSKSMLRQGYRPGTIRTYLKSMGPFFQDFGLSPQKGVALPDPGTQDVRVWSDAEVERIRDAASGDARLAVEIGLSMGLRQAEIFGLRWEDIREKEKVVRVDRQTMKDRPGTKPLKGKLSRTALVLRDWWPLHQRRTGPILEPLTSRTQQYMIQRVLDRAGLNGTGTSWHSLRHTYAARYLLAKGTIFGLQKSLGHSSVRVTEQAYLHLSSETVAEMEAATIYGRRVRRA